MRSKIVRKRIISIVLILCMLIGSTCLVQAEEAAVAGQPIKEQSTPDEPALVQSIPEETVQEEPILEQLAPMSSMTEEAAKVGMKVTLRFDAYGYTKVYPVTVSLPDTYRSLGESFGGYGLDLGVLKDPEYYTPLHAMAQYCLDQGKTPKDEIVLDTGYGSLNVADFLQVGSADTIETFLMFYVNNVSNGTDVLGSYPLGNGDYITLADWFWSDHSDIIYFDTESYMSSAGDAFNVQLHGMKDPWTIYSAEQAQILVLDAQGGGIDNTGGRIYEAGVTNANGTASVKIKEPGTYILAAERKNAQGSHEINRGYARVTVSPAAALTDEDAVEQAKEGLTLGDISAITSNITLPLTGSQGTSIQWTSSNLALINNEGKLKRPCDENLNVTMTATISKGAATRSKEFVVTVKGFSLELKELSVSPGTLSYETGKRDYTVYVPVGTTSVQVTCATEESYIIFINNKLKTDATTPQTEEVAVIDGTTITLNVKNTSYNKEKITKITVKYGNPAEPLPDLPNEWGQYLGNDRNNAVTSAKTPIDQVDLAWKSKTESTTGWSISGTPLLLNGNIYVARNNELQILDSKSGTLRNKAPLHSNLAWYSYLAYGDGKIFVPLGDGSVQAFDPTTLESLFITEIPDLGMQGVCAVYYKDGMIFVGATNGSEPDKSSGVYAAYNTIDLFKEQTNEIVQPAWTYKGKGFYGSGAVSVKKNEKSFLFFAGDDGEVQCVNPTDGSIVSTVTLEGAVRSPLVEDGGYIWTTTKAGKLYKLAISDMGVVSIAAVAELPQSTTNAPVVTGGKVYVTGGVMKKGYFSLYDMDLKLLARKDTEGRMNTPTVVTSYSDIYVYFTEYNSPGGLYMAKVTGNNNITMERLFLPKDENYCMSNVVIGEDGTIYFGNDSGQLFAVTSGTGDNPEPTPKPEPTPEPTPEAEPTPNPSPTPTPAPSPVPLQPELFVPTKRTMMVSAKKEEPVKSTSETIADNITDYISNQKESLTVKNAPDVIEPTVFEELKKHPNFKLILDCGKYTISIKGSDVRNAKAPLHTQIIEKEGALTKEEQETLGNYQIYELAQEEPLPGKLTVVYSLPAKFAEATGLYFYEGDNLQRPVDAVMQKQYVMFYLSKPGEFLLSDTAPQIITSEVNEDISNPVIEEETKAKKEGNPISMPVVLVGTCGLFIGGILTGTVMIMMRKRRKNGIWEEESNI